MPSRIKDTSWDFGPALALNNETHYVDSGGDKPPDSTDQQEPGTAKKAKSGLGDFSEIWKFLGQPLDLPPPEISPTSSGECLPRIVDSDSPDGAIGGSSSSDDAGGDTGPLVERHRQRQQDIVAPLLYLVAAANSFAGKDGPSRMATDGMDVPKKEKLDIAGPFPATVNGASTQDAIAEGEKPVEPLETLSEWEHANLQRKLERKEKRQVRKERRNAEKQAKAERIAAANAPPGFKLEMPTPVKIANTPVVLPKTPVRAESPCKRIVSPYKAAASYTILSRQPASISPSKDVVKVEGDNGVLKKLGKASPKDIQKHDAVSFSTPNYSAPRSQLHTPLAPSNSRPVPQSAPAKPNFLYPSAVQAPISHLNSQVLTYGAYATQSFGATSSAQVEAQSQGYDSCQSYAPHHVTTTNPVNHQTLLKAHGFKLGIDRQLDLFIKLMNLFPQDMKWLVSPMQLSSNKTTTDGIHVFVDASNIIIGFYEELRRHLGHPQRVRVQEEFQISFDSLVLLMERRRPVSKRILVGSKPEIPAFDTARAVGYKVDILDKVCKVKELTERQKYFHQQNLARIEARARRRSAGGANGQNSGSETTAGLFSPPEEKWVEQGVDEILHLNMLESLVDAEQPSTIVLATGDAAEAEYSAGFKKMVQRALDKGWKVELISWSRQISNEYRKAAFQKKYAPGQFTIIELDSFVRYLLDA